MTAAPPVAAPPAEPYVRLHDVGHVYAGAEPPFVALAGVSLDLWPGEFLSVVGPSGCGKSTLLKCIAGLERPASGRITVRGRPIDGPPDGLGVVFQRDLLVDWRDILGNVLLSAEFQGRDVAALRAPARTLLARFGLGAVAHRRPWELSGGMRQRAAICRALLTQPDLLLMDEPFGALDAMTRDDLNLELARLWQETRKTVLFITHGIAEAVFLSDRIALMARNPGRIVDIVTVNLPRPRLLGVRDSAAFVQLVAGIRQRFAELGEVQAA